MYSTYKKFSAQDIGQVPFNAHKQYSFISSSFEQNRLTKTNAQWTSASIDTLSSGAIGGNYPTLDVNNSLKYFQLDHLFYKNYKLSLNEKLGSIHYLKHKRELHRNVQIISIPNGLCGSNIKPGSFLLSASNHNISGAGTPYHLIIDDSYGNLYISGSDLQDYSTDIRANILRIGPEKGFKKYDLNVINDEFEAGVYYRRGKKNIKGITSFTKENVIDDSYFFNLLNYKDTTFTPIKLRSGEFSQINFNGTTSEIKIENDEKFHFNPGDDFTISFWTNISQSSVDTSYLISKSTTRTVIPSPATSRNGFKNLFDTGSNQLVDRPAGNNYPFEIYATGNELFFRRSDGDQTFTISSSLTLHTHQHITCRMSSSNMEIFINGIGSGTSGSEVPLIKRDTQNNANLYIGNKGGISNFLSGALSQINIYDDPLTDTQILNHYSSSNSCPYIGNIFYESGLVTITHPNYYNEVNLDYIGWKSEELAFTKEKPLLNVGGGAAGSINPTGLFFKPDGNRVYVTGEFAFSTKNFGQIAEFHLSSSWDIGSLRVTSSAENLLLNTSQSLANGAPINETDPQGVFFKPDGTRMYFVGNRQNKIYQYDLSESWAITSSVFNASSSISSEPKDLFWKPDGSRLYISDNALDQIKQYDVPTPWDITSIAGFNGGSLTETSNADFSTVSGAPAIGTVEAFSVKPDGRTVLIVEQAGNDSIHEFLLNTPWTFRTVSGNPDLTYVSTTTTINENETGNRSLFVRPDGRVLYGSGIGSDDIEQYNLTGSNRNEFNLRFQGAHLIYENEYQCTVNEHEYNFTLNPSARKNKNTNSQDIANFATSSLFKPYVTTVGLYNEAGELLVVGKLGQATRMSDETDTTFVIRWDK